VKALELFNSYCLILICSRRSCHLTDRFYQNNKGRGRGTGTGRKINEKNINVH